MSNDVEPSVAPGEPQRQNRLLETNLATRLPLVAAANIVLGLQTSRAGGGSQAAPATVWRESPTMTNIPLLHLGVFAPKNAGKSTTLAALHLVREGDGLGLDFADEATLRYIRPLSAELQRGHFPGATAVQDPDHLRMEAFLGEAGFQIEMMDFSGELADPIWDAGPAEFKKHVEDWFQQCDGLLLLIPCGSADDPLYLDALDKLLRGLAEVPTRHGSRERAIAVAFGQADLLCAARPESSEEVQALWEKVRGLRAYRRIKEQLARRKQAVAKYFLVSAVGWQFAAVPDPATRRVEPWRLFAPLAWLLRESSVLVNDTQGQAVDALRVTLRQHLQNSTWKIPDYRRLQREVEEVAARHHLLQGQQAEEVLELREQLRQSRRHQLRANWVYLAGLSCLLAVASWAIARSGAVSIYEQYERLRQELAQDRQVQARLAAYEEQIRPRGWDFLWGLQERRRAVDEVVAQDRELLARVQAGEALEQVLKADRQLAEARLQPRRHQAVLDLLAKHGQFISDNRQVKLILDETRTAWEADRQAWQQVREIPIHRPPDYQRKIAALQAYGSRPEGVHAAAAQELAQTVGQQEEQDRAAYQALQQAATVRPSSAHLASLVEQAGAYCASTAHARTRKAEVQEFTRQLEAYRKQPVQVTLQVQQMRIPKTFLTGWLTGPPMPSMTLTFRGQNFGTSKISTQDSGSYFAGTFNQLLGPLSTSWLDQTPFRVYMKVHRTLYQEEQASAQIPGPLLDRANSTLAIGPVQVDVSASLPPPPTLPTDPQ